MAYTFEGVFVERPKLGTEELEELFNGYVRYIQTPFVGAVISFKDAIPDEASEDENTMPVLYEPEKERAKIREGILEKSIHLFDSNIAYIHYSTWGGARDFVYGFACRNGQLIENSEQQSDEPDGDGILLSLQKSVGASFPSVYFAPFERGYFPNT